jgi:hypothetical protein
MLLDMNANPLFERETTHHVIGAFYEVYNTLGYGFLERVYRDALELELIERGRMVRKEVFVPVWYKRSLISTQRVDLIADERGGGDGGRVRGRASEPSRAPVMRRGASRSDSREGTRPT